MQHSPVEELAPPSALPTSPGASWVDRTWRWLESTSDLSFTGLLVAVVLLRAGAHIELDLEWLYHCVQDFPHLSGNFRCHNAAISVLPALLHVDTKKEWLSLYLVLTACTLSATLALIRLRYRGLPFKLVALWLGLSAMPVALLQTLVYYDVYLILGGSLLSLARNRFAIVAGGLLMGLTHPEAGVVAALSIMAVAFGLERARESRTKVAVLSCLLGAALTKLHGLLDPPPGLDRAGVLGRSLAKSVFHAAQTGTMGLYACYGLAWLLIGAYLLCAPLTKRHRAWLVLGLIVLPGVVTLITLDGTRVFVVASWPAFVLFVSSVCEREARASSPVPLRAMTCMALLMALVTPAYVSGFGNVSRPRIGTLAKKLGSSSERLEQVSR